MCIHVRRLGSGQLICVLPAAAGLMKTRPALGPKGDRRESVSLQLRNLKSCVVHAVR